MVTPQDNPFLGQSSDPQDPIITVRHLQVPRSVALRAKGLKLVLICELLLAVWVLFLGVGLLTVLIVVPTNIVGFYGAHLLRKNLLTAFVFLKTCVVVLVSFALTTLVLNWSQCQDCGSMQGEIPILTCIFVLVAVYQILCIVIARRIRYAIAIAEMRPQGNYELNQVDIQEPATSSPSQPQHIPVYPYPQYAPYSMPFAPHPQDGSVPQGYAVPPYAYAYPPPVNGDQQPPMAAVYPAYLYAPHDGQPTYTMPTQPAPSNNDSSALLHDVDLK